MPLDAYTALYAPTLIAAAYIFLAWYHKTANPLMVVMSGSMEPALRKGDLVVVSRRTKLEPEAGKVIVYRSGGERLVIHRIVGSRQVGEVIQIEARGDASKRGDCELVEYGQVVGEMVHRVPGLGYPVYILNRLLNRGQLLLL